MFEPPTTPVPQDTTSEDRLEAALGKVSTLLDTSQAALSSTSSVRHYEAIPHIFSHINMTYHIIHIVLESDETPKAVNGVWLDEKEVESANVGTGVKKVWSQVYGSWGNFDTLLLTIGESNVGNKRKSSSSAGGKAKAKPPSAKKIAVVVKTDEVVVEKKVMMPVMPLQTR